MKHVFIRVTNDGLAAISLILLAATSLAHNVLDKWIQKIFSCIGNFPTE